MQDGPSNPIEETLHVMGDLVKAGKIRNFGLSNESAWGTMTFLKHAEARSLPRVESVQNAYNLLNRTYEVALAEISMREHVSHPQPRFDSAWAEAAVGGDYSGNAAHSRSVEQAECHESA